MNRYILDTDTLIDFSKGREPVVSLISKWITNDDILGICPINIAEFYAGLPASSRKEWGEFFSRLMYWEISADAARSAGILRNEYKKRGITITTTDALVAAVGREQHATVVTSNTKDYPTSGVKLLAPRETN